MSRAWRLAIAAAQVLFLLALTVGVYVQLITLTPAAPSPEVAASASIGPVVRDDRVPAPVPISPDAHPPGAEPSTANGSAPAAGSASAGGVVFGAPAGQKPLLVAPNVTSPPRVVTNAAPLVDVAPLAAAGITAPIVTTTTIDVTRHRATAIASLKVRKDVSAPPSASRQGPKRTKQPRS